VEVLLRITDETARRELDDVFDSAMAPDVRCWELQGDGSWLHSDGRDSQAERLERMGELAV
jgi:polyphosphate kinase